MNHQSFDNLTKIFAARTSRRTAIAAGVATVATGTLGLKAYAGTPAARLEDACDPWSEADNLIVASKWVEVATNGQNLDILDEIVAPSGSLDAAFIPNSIGADEAKKSVGSLLTAYPDLHLTIDQSMTEDDFVVQQWSAIGTHQEVFLGIPATGKLATWTGINIYRLACGQIVQIWVEADSLARFGLATSDVGAPEATPSMTSIDSTMCVENTEANNESLALKWLGAWNSRDVARFEEVVNSENVVHHFGLVNGIASGLSDLQSRVEVFFDAFPDLTVTIEQVITDGNLVAARFRNEGTHLGQFLDIAPTGKGVYWTGMLIFRIECGLIVESWSEVSGYELRQQLGAVGETATPSS